MKLIKKISKKDDRKPQFNSLRPSRDKGYVSAEQPQPPADDPLEPFAWKTFFEEAQNMGMKIDVHTLARTNYKMAPTAAPVPETAMFGVSLDDLMDRQKKKYPEASIIPNFVEQCAQYIVKYGLKESGLFQSSSCNCEKIKGSRDSIDSGNGVDVQLHEHLKYIDVHTVAGLLKQFVREFPTPIIPSDVFDMLVACIHRGNDEMRKGINLLPRNSYNILEKIFCLLCMISKQEAFNDTDSGTLAEIFGPVIMWRNAITAGIDTQKTKDIANILIASYPLLFSKGTTVRPALGQYQPPSGMSKSASLSTLSFHTYQTALPAQQQPSPSKPESGRASSEAPSSNYMLEIYKNIKDGGTQKEDAEGSDEEEEDEDMRNGERLKRDMAHIANLSPTPTRSPNPKRRSGGIRDSDGEQGDSGGGGHFGGARIAMQHEDKEDKGKMPMGLRKSASENLANKYNNNAGGQQQKKTTGLTQFLKKIELKKK